MTPPASAPRKPIALVTMQELVGRAPNALSANPLVEHDTLRAFLEPMGFITRDVAWDDPTVDWTDFSAAILRSCWNYHLQPDAFLAWVDRVPNLLNPASLVKWNAHKRYLKELETRGVPVVPTVWVPQGEHAPKLSEILEGQSWTDAVVKPAVSAGAYRTRRFSVATAREAQSTLEQICAEGDAMVQPFLESVGTTAERSLIYFDGTFSHAIRRESSLLTGKYGGTLASSGDDEKWLAKAALSSLGTPWLYARVDVVRDNQGELRLMELELIEPFLYLSEHPHAASNLAAAIARWVRAFG